MKSKIDIHRIENSNCNSSYFVKRSYGNYIIFSDGLMSPNYEFLKSKGGVYRQFVESFEHINESQEKIFVMFGAAAVVNTSESNFHSKILVEEYNKAFKDHTVKFSSNKNGNTIVLKQGEVKIIFFGKSYFLKDGRSILVNGKDLGESIFNDLDFLGFQYAFFSNYNSDHMIEL